MDGVHHNLSVFMDATEYIVSVDRLLTVHILTYFAAYYGDV